MSRDRNVHRVACVDVPALPLQLLARARPEWRDAPLAVVEEDHPQARILFVDARAMAKGVRVGMRYAAALQLCRELRAAPVPPPMRESALSELLETLGRFSPKVELDREREGVLWLDPSGLGGLFGPLERWAARVDRAVERLALSASIVVGFARLPAWAVARVRASGAVARVRASGAVAPGRALKGASTRGASTRDASTRDASRDRGAFVIESPAEEASLAARAPLAHLEILPELRDALSALGVVTLGDFLALPRGDVGVRFGPDARALHELFADALRPPMQAVRPEEPIFVEAELEEPDDNLMRLLFCIKGGLHALMADLSRRALALRALEVRLELERAPRPMSAGDARAIDRAIERGAERAPPPARRLSQSARAGSSPSRLDAVAKRCAESSPSRSREGAGGRVARGGGDSIAIPARVPHPNPPPRAGEGAPRGANTRQPRSEGGSPHEERSERASADAPLTVVVERIEPARATRDALSVLELVRLRFSGVSLPARVERIVLEAEASRLDGTQLSLFAGRRHDPDAAARGIARLRAAFGDDAVTRPVLRDAWLPEEAFAWEPADRVAVPSVAVPTVAVPTVAVPTVAVPSVAVPSDEALLVRRVLPTPIELPRAADGRPRTSPPIEAMTGPYRLQGGFWKGEHARDYFYAERADGALLWIYRDRRSGRWFLHGNLD